MKNIQRYGGVRTGIVVNVMEGDGKDSPYERVDYVLLLRDDGSYETRGRIVPLTEEEKAYFATN